MFALEMIDPVELPSISVSELSKLPSYCCVYFVVESSGETVYIGETRNLKERWDFENTYGGHHIFKSISKDASIHWLKTPISRRKSIESLMITHFKPRLNKVIPTSKQALSGLSTKDLKEAYDFGYLTGFQKAIELFSSSKNPNLKFLEQYTNPGLLMCIPEIENDTARHAKKSKSKTQKQKEA